MPLPSEGDDVSEVVDILRKIKVYVQSANEQLGHSDSKGKHFTLNNPCMYFHNFKYILD